MRRAFRLERRVEDSHRLRWMPLRRLRVEPLEDRRLLDAGTLFVDVDAVGAATGANWTDAYIDVQSALTAAETLNADADPANDIDAIWIADGTYRPTAQLEVDDVRTATFSIVPGVSLIGGFAGGEASSNQRVWVDGELANKAILSGDLGAVGDISDNAYSVVFADTGADDLAVVDGLTITGGLANGDGSAPDRQQGGGVFVAGAGTLRVINTTLDGNSAVAGGAIYSADADLNVDGAMVRGNWAFGSGGGIVSAGNLRITHSTVTGNRSLTGLGGGIYSNGASTVEGSIVSGNSARHGGGIYGESGTFGVASSTLTGNDAFETGGGVFNDSGTLSVINSIVALNSASSSPDIEGSHDGAGGFNLIGVDPLFLRNPSPGADGVWATDDDDRGDLRLQPGSPAIDAGDDLLIDPFGWDVRQYPRVVDGDGDGNAVVDIGAVEAFVGVTNGLRITEIMHTPPLGSVYLSEQLEFVELTNVADATVDLTDVRFLDGIAFDFTDSAVTSLAPGEYVLVVKDLEAFAARYDTTGLLIAGEYEGRLRTEGEILELVGPINQEIAWFGFGLESPGEIGGGLSLLTESLPFPLPFDPYVPYDFHAGTVYGGTPGRSEQDATDTAAISGFVAIDHSADGAITPTASHGVPGIVVNLLDDADTIVATTTTSAIGGFNFFNVAPGIYRLEVLPWAGLDFTMMDVGDEQYDSDVDPLTGRTDPFVLGPKWFRTDLAAGVIPAEPLAAIAGGFFDDEDGDGIGPPGSHNRLPDTVMQLLDSTGDVFASRHVSTQGDGPFDIQEIEFRNLPAGTYRLHFDLTRDTEFSFTLMDQGANDQIDSDVDPDTGLTEPFTLLPDQVETSIGVGFIDEQNVRNLENHLRFAELMVNPPPAMPGEPDVDKEEFEFIELINRSDEVTLNLAGLRFVDGVAFDFSESPVTELPPGERIVVVRDLVAFSARYDTSEILVAGQYSGRLNNDGERLELNAPINQEVLNWRYDRDEVPGTQGLGHSITYGLPGFSWGTGQPSAVYLGTPGRPPEARHEGPVVVNEVLANSDNGAGEVDAVELLNTSTAPIDIGDWQLMSNNGFVQIAAGTTLLPGEYHVVSLDVYSEVHDHQGDNAHEFFHDYCGYRMDLFGEFFVDNDLLLVGVLPGDSEPTVVDYIHQIRPVERGVTVGRLPNGDGPLAPNASNTLGSPNSEPLLQAVVVSELMYNPPGDDFFGNEFLELYNASISTENFFVRIDVDDDTLRPGYSPLEMTIAPGEAITLSQRDYNGQLSNGGERLRVLREGAIVAYPTEFDVFQPVYVVDQVTYDDDPPWPESADGDGDSLHRFFPDWVGDDPASWYAAPPTPGAYQVGGGVLDRHIVYNDSAFDGNDPAASVADTAAIDPTKDALLPGQTAAPCNVSNYAAGINGIAIDLPNATAAISPTDFAFRVGNDDQPDAWGAPPPPTGFEFLPGQGTLDSDRVVIVWNDGSIVNTWLQVAVSANENTGLVAADVFYFGNAVGETGNDPNNALVTAADVIAVRDHPRGPANRAPIDDPHDVNRNGLVDAIDVLLARNAATGPFSALRLITPVTPVAPPPVEAVAEGERMMDRMPTASVGMAPGANSDHKGTQDTKKKRTG